MASVLNLFTYRNMIWIWSKSFSIVFKVLDATGKFPDGLLQGNFNALGSYSSCLEIEANPKYGKPFSGKFGGAQFSPLEDPEALNLVYGVCLPSTCTDGDFYNILCNLFQNVW